MTEANLPHPDTATATDWAEYTTTLVRSVVIPNVTYPYNGAYSGALSDAMAFSRLAHRCASKFDRTDLTDEEKINRARIHAIETAFCCAHIDNLTRQFA